METVRLSGVLTDGRICSAMPFGGFIVAILLTVDEGNYNIDRQTKHSLPLSNWPTIPLSGKWGGFVE